MNRSNITIWYESGSVEDVHMPDPGFWNPTGTDGYAAQSEFIDFANPDEGIFLERLVWPLAEVEYENSEDEPDNEARVLKERFLVVGPEQLKAATVVVYQGVTVYERDASSPFECGLAIRTAWSTGEAAGEYGDDSDDADGEPEGLIQEAYEEVEP